MTKEEFERSYAEGADITVSYLRELGGIPMPCDCGEEGCQGWQMTFPQDRERIAQETRWEAERDVLYMAKRIYYEVKLSGFPISDQGWQDFCMVVETLCQAEG